MVEAVEQHDSQSQGGGTSETACFEGECQTGRYEDNADVLNGSAAIFPHVDNDMRFSSCAGGRFLPILEVNFEPLRLSSIKKAIGCLGTSAMSFAA